MPRAFLLKRDFDDGNYFGEGRLPFAQQEDAKAASEDCQDIRRSKRPVKIKKEEAEISFLNSFQKKKKLSYPADVRIDGRVNDIGKILRFANDFINNGKKMSGQNPQKSSHGLREISLISEHGIFRENEALEEKTGALANSFNENTDSCSVESKRVSPAPNKKCSQLNKANELSDAGAKSRQDKTVHKCNQCGKVFKTKYTLSIHLKMPDHTQSRPFVCNVCGKGFRLSSTLCRHKIIHTEKKPHKCDECGKCFNRSSTLKTHLRTHSEKKAFICDICGKGFHQKGNLRNHIMIHTGEKPFRCNQCNRAFNKMSNLKFHMHTHSDNLPYHCRTCRKRFSKKTDLKDHVEEAH